MFELTQKVAVVTGAGRGIGKAIALALAKQGAAVAVTGTALEDCQSVVQEIAATGGVADGFKMDVTDRAEVERVFNEIVSRFGRVDILVNNAGVYTPKSALELTEEDWDHTLAVNLKGQFLCAQRAAKEMIKQKYGRIINIASIASGQVGIGIAEGVHYTASKGGVIGMTEALAAEWAVHGILVNAIAPGLIDTPMSRKERLSKEEMQAFLDVRVPLKRIGKPEEVAVFAVFLASDEASYATGSTFYVDGGWLAS